MTISNFLNYYSNILIQNGFESAFLDVEVIFCFVSGLNRVDIISRSNDEVSNIVEKKFKKLFKRRLKHEPIAYILGYKNFFGFDFFINKDVLIPRPLTEHLVELVLSDDSWNNCKDKNIIEIGTGSGCIIVSILKKVLNHTNNFKLNVFASDISSKALKVAKKNAKYFCLFEKIKFLKGSLKFPFCCKKFDLILANLPYVDIDSVDLNNDNQKDLIFEPKLALYHKDRGFYLIRKLLKKIINKKLLNKNGIVFLEIEKGQSERIRYEFSKFFRIEEFYDGRIVKLMLD